MPQRAFRPYTLWAVRLTCRNSARLTIFKLGRGVRSLKLIAVTAPMLGAVALLDGLRQAIKAWPPPAWGDVAGGWSEMFAPFAMSLAIASLATTCYGILTAMIESFRVEAETAIPQLLNDLVRPSTKS